MKEPSSILPVTEDVRGVSGHRCKQAHSKGGEEISFLTLSREYQIIEGDSIKYFSLDKVKSCAIITASIRVSAMKTFMAREGEVERKWYVVDASGKTLGRLATGIARLLTGKNKPQYTPHLDTGDFVIVVNAGKVRVTGKKEEDKFYYRHSLYPGGIKKTAFKDMIKRRPEEVFRRAVRGMLPKNRLSRRMITKLKVYAGADHPHEAQRPQTVEI